MEKMTLNELKVLSALSSGERYGLEIIETIKEAGDGAIYLGSLYNTLSRLEKKGYVKPRWGEDTPERGGNRRKYYKLTGTGARVLRNSQKTFMGLWKEAMGNA